MRYITAALFIFIFPTGIVFASSPAQLYITQVQTTGGAGKTNQDFVEFFNPGSTAVGLKGYRLVKRSQNSQDDTLIKSWSSDATVAPKSFYLWANSSFTSIAVKPDVATSATLSDDNGVALRFGANDSGKLIDSLAWGKVANGFNSAAAINPGAGQAIFRKDWYASTSSYFISTSKPRNSAVSDIAAAFAQSQSPQPAQPQAAPGQIIHSTNQAVLPTVVPTISQADAPPVASTSITAVGETQTPVYAGDNSYQNNTKPGGGNNYLILVGGAILALIFLIWRFFFIKPK